MTPEEQWYRWPSFDYENKIRRTNYGIDLPLTEETQKLTQLSYEQVDAMGAR